LHELPFERGDKLPVFIQNFVWLRFDPLLHLPFELPFLSLDAAGSVAAAWIEYLQQVLDFDVLEVLWRQILQNLGEFVEQKIFESRVCLDFFNPVLKEKIIIYLFSKQRGNQRRESQSISASSNYFEKK